MAIIQEAARRGLLSEQDAAIFAEAEKRGLVEKPDITKEVEDFRLKALFLVNDIVDGVKNREIGFGRGLLDVAEGLQQIGIITAEKMGVVSPNERTDFEARVKEEREFFANTPVGQTLNADVGRVAGNVAPFLAVPPVKGGLLARAGGETAIGAGIGATAFAEDSEERLKNTLLGGGTAGAVTAATGVASATANAVSGRLRPAAQEISDLGKEFDVPLTLGDIAKKPILQKIEVLMESFPVVGLAGPRTRQGEKAKAAAEKLVDNAKQDLAGESFRGISQIQKVAQGGGPRAKAARALLLDIQNAGDDWNRIIQVSGNLKAFRAKLAGDRKFRAVSDLAGDAPVPPGQTVAALDNAIAQADDAIIQSGLGPFLQNIRNEIGQGARNFTQMQQFRSDLADEISNFYKGGNAVIGGKGVGVLQSVKEAVDADLETFAKSQGGALSRRFQEANRFWQERVVPFKDAQLARALKDADPDTVYGKFISRQSKDKAQRFFNALDPKGKQAVRTRMLSEAFETSVNEQGIFSPAKFAANLERLEKARGVVFQGVEERRLQGFVRLMRHAERGGQFLENPPTGQRNLLALIAGGGVVFEPGTVAGIAALSAGLRGVMTKSPFKELFLTSTRMKVGSPGMQKIVDQLETLLARTSATATSREQ